MDTKQLINFNPEVANNIISIGLNESVLNLTNSSSSSDIITAFDSISKFNELLDTLRNYDNLTACIVINNTTQGGLISANIITQKNSDTLHINYIYNGIATGIDIVNNENIFSCTKTEINLAVEGVDLSNYLAKNNTTEFTPTGDYQPATKKYVDDLTDIANIINIDISTILNGGTINFTLPDNNHLYYLLCLKGLNDAGGNYYLPLMRYDTSEFKNYGYDGLIVGNTGNNQYYKNNNIYRISIGTNAGSLEATLVISKYINILTESEYSALGNTSNDGVLYFVTPD